MVVAEDSERLHVGCEFITSNSNCVDFWIKSSLVSQSPIDSVFCSQYTTPLVQETVTSFDDAEAKCAQWGARLFQPRSSQALSYFSIAEVNHMKEELFRFNQPASTSSIIAIGLWYQQMAGDSQPHLYYRLNITPFQRMRRDM